jgi:hypothetical protein
LGSTSHFFHICGLICRKLAALRVKDVQLADPLLPLGNKLAGKSMPMSEQVTNADREKLISWLFTVSLK